MGVGEHIKWICSFLPSSLLVTGEKYCVCEKTMKCDLFPPPRFPTLLC